MANNKFLIINFFKSFKYAINGLKIVFNQERNAQIHLFAMVVVIVLGFVLKISGVEWLVISMAIGFVLALEIVNTAIERIANFISPQKNQDIKVIKDLAAAAVLVGAIVAFVVGVIIFLPKILKTLTNG